MYAIEIDHFGGPEVLRWVEVPPPVVGEADVLIDVVASGVNRADVLQREGNYPPPAGAPPYPGLEVAGRVAAVGSAVVDISVGESVCALVGGGGYAEQVAVPSGQVLRLPPGVSLPDAAALPEAACTVWLGLLALGQLQRGQSVFVNGGSSGIGSMAIQVAKATGATVIATAGSEAKTERCRSLGADLVINHRVEDFEARIAHATGGAGVNIVVDLVGGSALEGNVRALATEGRLIAIGVVDGMIGRLDLVELITRRRSIHTLSLRRLDPGPKAAVVAAVRTHLWPLIAEGKVRPVVDRRVPLRQASAAHELMESGAHFGKIVLVTDDRDVSAPAALT